MISQLGGAREMGNNMGWLGIAMMIVMAGFSLAFLIRAGQAAVRRARGLRTGHQPGPVWRYLAASGAKRR
jgi:hypothetical protein